MAGRYEVEQVLSAARGKDAPLARVQALRGAGGGFGGLGHGRGPGFGERKCIIPLILKK
jgi:hypothetical protein